MVAGGVVPVLHTRGTVHRLLLSARYQWDPAVFTLWRVAQCEGPPRTEGTWTGGARVAYELPFKSMDYGRGAPEIPEVRVFELEVAPYCSMVIVYFLRLYYHCIAVDTKCAA